MQSKMKFSHVLLTRPRPQSEELAEMLKPLGLEAVVQPAFVYAALEARLAQKDDFSALLAAGPGDLVLFTSPRAVMHGLAQLPPGVLSRVRVAAIGPATARALSVAGVRVNIRAAEGYTSEALLQTLASEPVPVGRPSAFIMAAPGGREKLGEGLGKLGWQARTIMVYRSEPAELDKQALAMLGEADGTLSVWTSANAMKALSQRLPPASWFRICQGEWLVISDRLKRLARAYGPEGIHLAAGPGNQAIHAAIRNLC